jgi:hypothetical protein
MVAGLYFFYTCPITIAVMDYCSTKQPNNAAHLNIINRGLQQLLCTGNVCRHWLLMTGQTH